MISQDRFLYFFLAAFPQLGGRGNCVSSNLPVWNYLFNLSDFPSPLPSFSLSARISVPVGVQAGWSGCGATCAGLSLADRVAMLAQLEMGPQTLYPTLVSEQSQSPET